MILTVDVKYNDDNSWKAAALSFNDFTDETYQHLYTLTDKDVDITISEYIPGEFYKRELPIIKALLDTYNLNPDILIVDGYVRIYDKETESMKNGLGAHVKEDLNLSCEVIGIAKTYFHKAETNTAMVYHGMSNNPLYVQSYSGYSYMREIYSMHGKHRIPTLIKLTDYFTRHDS